MSKPLIAILLITYLITSCSHTENNETFQPFIFSHHERSSIIKESGFIKVYDRNGNIYGLKTKNIKNGSVLDRMNIRNGDIILSINDNKINNKNTDSHFYKAWFKLHVLKLEVKSRSNINKYIIVFK